MTEYRKTEAEHPFLFNIYFYSYIYPRALWVRHKLEKQVSQELRAIEDAVGEDAEYGRLVHLYGRVARFEKKHPRASRAFSKAKLCIYEARRKFKKIVRKDSTESD